MTIGWARKKWQKRTGERTEGDKGTEGGNVIARRRRRTERGDRTKKYKGRENSAGVRKGNKSARGIKKCQKEITVA
jgi:hypothetical protein